MSGNEAGYVVLVGISVKAEHHAQFKAAILANAAQSLAQEPACWVFDVAVSDDGRDFCLYEIYQDRQGFETHLKTEHFLEFDRLTKPWLETKNVQTFLKLKS